MSTKKKAAVKTEKKARKARTGTKMEKARTIFASMKGKERKDVIAAFMEKCKMSKAAASTYYQLIKNPPK